MKELFEDSMEGNRVVIDEKDAVIVFKQVPEMDILNFYFEKAGRKFFFKANSKYTLDVSELLSYTLDKEAGVDSVEFLPAVFKTEDKVYHGVMSENIIKNKQDELINGLHLLKFFEETQREPEPGMRKERFNTIEHYKMALELLLGERNGKKFLLDKNFFMDLAKHMISGFVRCDEDFHAHNIPIVISYKNENTKVLRVGKLFDNSMSFLIKSHKSDIRDGFETLTRQEKASLVQKSLLNSGFPFQVKATSNRQTARHTISREIAGLIIKYPELERHYQAYKNINIKKVLSEFKQDNKYDFIKDSDIDLAELVVKSSINLLDQAISYENMQNMGPLKFLKKANDEVSLEL